jgi:cell shape-determining protein MreC
VDYATQARGREQYRTVPNTTDGWIMRILVALVALLFVAVSVLFGQISYLEDYTRESRQLRQEFEGEQIARTCELLHLAGVDATRRAELRC